MIMTAAVQVIYSKMGIIQNIVDSFKMKIGKSEEVYPVKVIKHRVHGDEPILTGFDQGRTLIDEQGNKKFELRNEPNAQGYVKYEDFRKTDTNREIVDILMINRDKFVPLRSNYNLELPEDVTPEEIEDENLEVDMNALEYTLSVSTFLDWADKHIEQSWQVVETTEDAWYQTAQAKWAIIMVSTGLFFVFLAVANGEFYLKPFGQKITTLAEALNNANVGGASSQ